MKKPMCPTGWLYQSFTTEKLRGRVRLRGCEGDPCLIAQPLSFFPPKEPLSD